MSERPRILFLSQCLPYPPHSGVRARTVNILKQLAVEFHVTLLAFSRRSHQRDADARTAAARALDGLVHHVDPAVPIPGEASRARKMWDHVRSVVTGRPYAFYTYRSRRFQSQLRRLLAREAFDLIHLDSLDLYGWVADLPPVPVTCTHHSIESQLLRRHAQWVAFRPLGRYLAYQADLLERVERARCPTFRANLMMSGMEAEQLRTLAPGAPTLVVPNGVDTSYFAPQPEASVIEGRVVFVGDTSTFPNRDAVEYLLDGVWPLIRRARPDATLALIGNGTDHAGRPPGAETGVLALGRVPDVRPHLGQASCAVVPLRVGGGTRLKILDAWAMGKAVVSTPIGCEGLDAIDGENILVRDDPPAFAHGVLEVLRRAELRARLGRNARATAAQVYSWDAVGRELRAAYWKIVSSAGALVAH